MTATQCLGVNQGMIRLYTFVLTLFISVNTFAFYPQNYPESRTHFHNESSRIQKIFKDVETSKIVIPTQASLELTIDTLYIPAQKKPQNLVILTSGIHGAEANAGAALLFALLEKLPLKNHDHTGYLLVHSVNPYGHATGRRVSESNVDLNRNMSANSEHFTSNNDSYANLADFLNPKIQLSARWTDDLKLFAKSFYYLATLGKKQITQAVVGGQYQFPHGIYFGGKSSEPQVELLKQEWQVRAKLYSRVLHLDLHTGYGEKGRLHFFSERSLATHPSFSKLFANLKVDFGEDKDFYKTSGSFSEFTIQVLADKQVIPMTLEFGTLDSQTILGGFYSLRNMIYENQGHFFGYTDRSSETKALGQFKEMFDPSDTQWRQQMLQKGLEAIELLTERLDHLTL